MAFQRIACRAPRRRSSTSGAIATLEHGRRDERHDECRDEHSHGRGA